MSADQQADRLDNLSGDPPGIGPHPSQEFSPEVDVTIGIEAQGEVQVAPPVYHSTGVNPEIPLELNTVREAVATDVQFQARPELSETADGRSQATKTTGHKIRQVSLLPGESPTHIFSGDEGLIAELPGTGQLLVLTNQRLIAFCNVGDKQETYLVPMNEVKHVVVKAGSRSASMLLQGSLLAAAGIFIYLVLGYWLTNQIEGPTIPVLHMDVAPFIALIVVLTGLAMIVQVYFTKPDGTVTVQGDGLQFVLPFHGDDAQRQIFEMVNSAFAARHTMLQDGTLEEAGHSPLSGTAGDSSIMGSANASQQADGDDSESP